MTDDAPPNETPMQRALRLKKAALEARNTPGAAFNAKQNAALPPGSAKPWMRKN